jgi:hypothetical protein
MFSQAGEKVRGTFLRLEQNARNALTVARSEGKRDTLLRLLIRARLEPFNEERARIFVCEDAKHSTTGLRMFSESMRSQTY